MSTMIMSACWPIQGMSASQKAVLVSLADQANDDGVCWPSIGHISMRTCLSERAVQAAIKWLISAGALSVNERNGRSTVYTVTPAAYAPPQEMHPANNVNTPANSVVTPANAAPAPANAAPITINNRNRTVIEPSIGASLPDWLPETAWADWVSFKGKKLTAKAKQLNLKTLTDLHTAGNDPKAVIEQSIERGWTGLFPLKTNSANAGRKTPALENFKEKAYVGTDEAAIDWMR